MFHTVAQAGLKLIAVLPQPPKGLEVQAAIPSSQRTLRGNVSRLFWGWELWGATENS